VIVAWRAVKHSLGLLVALVVFEYFTHLDLSRPSWPCCARTPPS